MYHLALLIGIIHHCLGNHWFKLWHLAPFEWIHFCTMILIYQYWNLTKIETIIIDHLISTSGGCKEREEGTVLRCYNLAQTLNGILWILSRTKLNRGVGMRLLEPLYTIIVYAAAIQIFFWANLYANYVWELEVDKKYKDLRIATKIFSGIIE